MNCPYKRLITAVFTFNFLRHWFPWDKFSDYFAVGVIFTQPTSTREHDCISLFVCHCHFLDKHGPAATIAVISDTKLRDLQTDGHGIKTIKKRI